MQQETLLAVYGTLKAGEGNNYLLEDAPLLGEHITEPEYTMHQHGFPIVVQGGETPITCEIYAVKDPRVVERVNRLEGFSGTKDHPSNWYDRKTIQTLYGPAEMFYMKEPQTGHIIPDGIWKRSK